MKLLGAAYRIKSILLKIFFPFSGYKKLRSFWWHRLLIAAFFLSMIALLLFVLSSLSSDSWPHCLSQEQVSGIKALGLNDEQIEAQIKKRGWQMRESWPCENFLIAKLFYISSGVLFFVLIASYLIQLIYRLFLWIVFWDRLNDFR